MACTSARPTPPASTEAGHRLACRSVEEQNVARGHERTTAWVWPGAKATMCGRTGLAPVAPRRRRPPPRRGRRSRAPAPTRSPAPGRPRCGPCRRTSCPASSTGRSPTPRTCPAPGCGRRPPRPRPGPPPSPPRQPPRGLRDSTGSPWIPLPLANPEERGSKRPGEPPVGRRSLDHPLPWCRTDRAPRGRRGARCGHPRAEGAGSPAARRARRRLLLLQAVA